MNDDRQLELDRRRLADDGAVPVARRAGPATRNHGAHGRLRRESDLGVGANPLVQLSFSKVVRGEGLQQHLPSRATVIRCADRSVDRVLEALRIRNK